MIIPMPSNNTWDVWCQRMAELFATQQLGTVPEECWQDWASGMQGIGYFVQNGVPDPRGFDVWQEWAERVVGVMNIQGNEIL